MIPTGSTADEGRGFAVEIRKAGRLCDFCGTYIHVGQPAKVGGMRVVHEGCTHPAERDATEPDAEDVEALVDLLDNATAYTQPGRGLVTLNTARAEAVLASDWLATHDAEVRRAAGEQVAEAHPVTATRRCGNRLAVPVNPPPGPPAPPVWCNLPAEHDGDCRTWDGVRLAGYARGGIGVEKRPPVVTYRCGTCNSPQDHTSPTPCDTLRIAREVTR